MGIEQFRSQHPAGGILSELVLYEQGQYVVRCCLTVGGETIATGLSAAPTVEAAEEQARDRALALFAQLAAAGPYQGPPSMAQTWASVAPPAVMEAAKPTPPPAINPAPPSKPAPRPEIIPTPPPAVISPSPMEGSDPPLEPKEPEAMGDRPPIAPDPIPNPPTPVFDDPLPPEPEEPEPLPPEAFTPAPPPAAPGEPIDFSDIIAKTNLELKRLGWTSDQGRTYIMETYGKRSRQILADHELVEFLRYLESLTS